MRAVQDVRAGRKAYATHGAASGAVDTDKPVILTATIVISSKAARRTMPPPLLVAPSWTFHPCIHTHACRRRAPARQGTARHGAYRALGPSQGRRLPAATLGPSDAGHGHPRAHQGPPTRASLHRPTVTFTRVVASPPHSLQRRAAPRSNAQRAPTVRAPGPGARINAVLVAVRADEKADAVVEAVVAAARPETRDGGGRKAEATGSAADVAGDRTGDTVEGMWALSTHIMVDARRASRSALQRHAVAGQARSRFTTQHTQSTHNTRDGAGRRAAARPCVNAASD